MGIFAAAVGVVAGVALLVDDERGGPGDDVTSVLRRSGELLGERVTVTGRVSDVLGATSFTMTDGARRLLVLDISAIAAIDNDLDGVIENELVTVSGVLRTLDVGEIERYADALVAEQYHAFLGSPVIMADSFRPR